MLAFPRVAFPSSKKQSAKPVFAVAKRQIKCSIGAKHIKFQKGRLMPSFFLHSRRFSPNNIKGEIMKNIKNISILILLLFESLFMFACKEKIQIIVNSECVEMEVAEEYFIEVTVENLENPVFEYKLEGDAISLEENFVVGLKEGNAKVIVSLKDYPDVEAVTVNISVKNVLPSQIKTKDEIRILIDETEQIEYTFEPEIAVATVSFESKNPNVVTVSNDGVVKGISEGSTTIVIKVNSVEVNVTKEINVICAGDGKPTITYNSDYKEKTLVNWNTEFDPTQGVKVEDFEDGDITKNIRIVNDIDTQEYGLQTVQLEVSDSDGNKIKENYYSADGTIISSGTY
jgi:hypothetical protein